MRLSELFTQCAAAQDREITGICLDSRQAREGDLFFCLHGLETDGHRFAERACQAGACAVVHTDEIPQLPDVAYIRVDDANRELNRVCDLFFGHPSRQMTVFGVTGTNGKTTTTSVIQDVLGSATCGYMGTNGVRYGQVSRVPSLTTPDAVEIHGNLKEMVDHGMQAAAMEVSSHGLAMGRVDTVDFDVAVFTNLTYDHLDYHGTMEAYFEAKQLLFRHMRPDGVAVLNVDDVSFEELSRCCACRYVTYGIRGEADYRAEEIELGVTGSRFVLCCGGDRYPVQTNLAAEYNIYNLLAAVAAMHETGTPLEKILPALATLQKIDGRMEVIDEGQPFTLIVDYAHTPDGFEKIFAFAEELAKGRDIYAVFGCAGKRDRVKRKVLGHIAGAHCRKIFVTEEDPRTERAEEIAAEIISGAGAERAVFVSERYAAIAAAVDAAKPGDCVLVLGKGDEPYMYYAEGRKPWMGDHLAARELVRRRVARETPSGRQ